MQRIANIIKPSILKKGKYQNKLSDDDDSSEELPLKLSKPGVSRRGSFRLTRKDSSRSITSEDPTLQSSVSTFNSSISSIVSVPQTYDEPLRGNESYSSLKHIENLKPRNSRAVQDDEHVQLRKSRSLPPNKRSRQPQVAPSTDEAKTNPRRSKTVQAEREVPGEVMSRPLSTVKRSSSSRRITDSKAKGAPQRSSSCRRITDSKANGATQKSNKTGTRSLDDFMDQYDKIVDDYPEARQENDTDYGESKSVTGW
jgi:hypothetical protein